MEHVCPSCKQCNWRRLNVAGYPDVYRCNVCGFWVYATKKREFTCNEMRESMGLKPIRSDNDILEEGEWLWLGGDDLIRNHKWSCSKCGRGVKEQENYCPECGLKMKKEATND